MTLLPIRRSTPRPTRSTLSPLLPLQVGGPTHCKKGPTGPKKYLPPYWRARPNRLRVGGYSGGACREYGCLDPQSTTPSGDRLNRKYPLRRDVEGNTSARASSQSTLRVGSTHRLGFSPRRCSSGSVPPTGRVRHRPAPSPAEVSHVRE